MSDVIMALVLTREAEEGARGALIQRYVRRNKLSGAMALAMVKLIGDWSLEMVILHHQILDRCES